MKHFFSILIFSLVIYSLQAQTDIDSNYQRFKDSLIKGEKNYFITTYKHNFYKKALSLEVSCYKNDSLILVKFFNNLNGNDWHNNDGWLKAPVYEWYGIQLNAQGRVTSISLPYNNLQGQLISDLSDLDSLKYLDLSINNITGQIPKSLGQLESLEYINLSFNQLSGLLPVEIYNLHNLKTLILGSNKITGVILPDVKFLHNLEVLDISINDFFGNIPEEIKFLTNLKYLDLSSNNLTGSIPEALYNLYNLQRLYLYRNKLTGKISDRIGNLINLVGLNLSSNHFYGPIPQSIGNLVNIETLDLSDNQLTGEIPNNITKLQKLRLLDLSQNQLICETPAGLKNLPLMYLFLHNNQLTKLNPLPKIWWFTCYNNNLDFEDLQADSITPSRYYYHPQNFANKPETINPNNGDTITLNCNVNGLGNHYQWYKNGVKLEADTNRTLTINNFTDTSKGKYYCIITNSQYPYLTLRTYNFYLALTPDRYNIQIINSSDSGTVIGQGLHYYGDTITIKAIAQEINLFDGFYNNSKLITKQNNYNFVVTTNLSAQTHYIPKKEAVYIKFDQSLGEIDGDSIFNWGETIYLKLKLKKKPDLILWLDNKGRILSSDTILSLFADKYYEEISVKILGAASTNNQQKNNCSIYPNPAKNHINITLPLPTTYTIKIFTLSGKEVINQIHTGQTVSINIQNLPSGIYILTIKSPNKSFTKKLIIQK